MQVPSLVILAVLVAVGWTKPAKNVDHSKWVNSGEFEGDIVLDPSQLTKVGVTDSALHWPDATMYYQIATNFSSQDKDVILDAIKEYHKRTCVKLVERTNQNDYVKIENTNGCSSSVGKIGGAQQLNLGHGCVDHGIIIHELLHAFGVWHEQSAPERDEYVIIVWENIEKGFEGNFAKYNASEVSNFGIGYDYGSIMHYTADAFSKNGKMTIIPTKDPNAVIGKAKSFSEKDIKKLNKMYKCE